MTYHSPSHPTVAPLSDQAKASAPKNKTRSVLVRGLKRSKRVLGTLHLPAFVWPR